MFFCATQIYLFSVLHAYFFVPYSGLDFIRNFRVLFTCTAATHVPVPSVPVVLPVPFQPMYQPKWSR